VAMMPVMAIVPPVVRRYAVSAEGTCIHRREVPRSHAVAAEMMAGTVREFAVRHPMASGNIAADTRVSADASAANMRASAAANMRTSAAASAMILLRQCSARNRKRERRRGRHSK